VLWLALLGCPHPTPSTPASSTAHDDCVEDCYQHRQMQAIGVDQIRARCSDECAAAHDPKSLYPAP
jgi:hypothetical protein